MRPARFATTATAATRWTRSSSSAWGRRRPCPARRNRAGSEPPRSTPYPHPRTRARARAAAVSMSEHKPASNPSGPQPFLTTRWSLVLEAGKPSNETSRRALSELCETYWYPLYAFVRRRGYRREDAQDLTQAFFARLLEKQVVVAADPARGRFRSFLLGSLKNFLANEWDRELTQKRGGGRALLSLDFQLADVRFVREPVTHATPEKEFERNWAVAVLERALARLQSEYETRGKQALFTRLKPALIAPDEDEPRP